MQAFNCNAGKAGSAVRTAQAYLQGWVVLLVKVVPHIQAAIHFDGVEDTRPVKAGCVVPSVTNNYTIRC